MEILKEKKIEFQSIEYIKKGLTRDEIISISKKLNLRPKDFIRRKDKIVTELGLEKELENDDKILDAIITYPKILERPIIIYKEKAIIARPAELLYDFL